MVKISVNVCDVCHDPTKPTTQYRLTGRGLIANMDLCEGDAAPLEVALKRHGRRPAPRRSFEDAITTIEELEAKKARQG